MPSIKIEFHVRRQDKIALRNHAMSRPFYAPLERSQSLRVCEVTTANLRRHATLDRITHMSPDLESAELKAKSLFDTLNMPQDPDGLRILNQDGVEVFSWTLPRNES